MAETCSFCASAIAKNGRLKDFDLTTEENKDLYEIVCDIFGGVREINLTSVCIECYVSLRNINGFRNNALKTNKNLRKSSSTLTTIDRFIGSVNEEVKPEILDGVMMIVPQSKKILIENYKLMKQVYVPTVPLIKCSKSSENTNLQVDSLKSEPSIQIEADTMMLNESNNETMIQVKDEEINPFEVVQCKVEPNELVNDPTYGIDWFSYEPELSSSPTHSSSAQPNSSSPDNFNNSDYNYHNFFEKLTEEEKQWIQSQIIKKTTTLKQKNGSRWFVRCLVCQRKMFNYKMACYHVFSKHLRHQKAPPSSLQGYLTPEEIEFVEENIKKIKREKQTVGKCKICNKFFKNYQLSKEHVVAYHLNKKLTEVFPERMIWKICRKGKIEGGFNCIICNDRGIEGFFRYCTDLNKHLRYHEKKDLKTYANKKQKKNQSTFDYSHFDHFLSF